jgi:class 3 adenylate cyclase/tetratricopeptide (TPR) repeat protein
MSDGNTNRRLAAVVSADVAGYSRLMGSDEEGTLADLKSHRAVLIDPKVAEHHGRIVKTSGDGLLVEFASVVDALRCWLEIQHGMAERNKSVPEERQIQFRVGVNLGDIIVDADDIFGDGVNIAARLEAIAAPGGICVSGAVVDQVRQKLPLGLEDLGERALKNIDRPVRAYRVSHSRLSNTGGGPNGTEAHPAEFEFALPERPSIAIMPFRNLNRDAEHDFIAEGIGLGIQTLLVQLPGLFLINATSHQGYREERETAVEAMKSLPVRYTLEGNVQHAGARVRVMVHITDLKDGSVIWAETYDRDLEDVFALQDDITRKVIASLNIKLIRSDWERILTRDLRGDGAWKHFLRGVSYIYAFNKDDNTRAREEFEKLYELRPDRVTGAAYVALTHWLDLARSWTESPADSLRRAAEWAAKAKEYPDNDGLGHVVLGFVRLHEGKYDEALALCEESLQYRSNCPAALGQTAAVQIYSGEARRAVKSARESLAVRTICPPVTINLLATAYRDCGEVELSISAAREAARIDPQHTDALATLCSDLVYADKIDEAKQVAKQIVKINPEFRLNSFAAKHPYRDKSTLKYFIGALKRAGLPA